MMPLHPNKFSVKQTPFASDASRRGARAFTLAEMLVVLAIIALLAALALPAIRGNTEAVAIRAAAYQLVEDLSFARQKAISQRSTVAVVFLTDAIANTTQVDPSRANLSDERENIVHLQAGVFTHYALYSFRRVGDQPGQATATYLTEWKSLPEKTFFPTNNQFTILDLPKGLFPFPFSRSLNTPTLPYIAFDHEGRLVGIADLKTGRGTNHTVSITNSIARGAVFYGRDPQGVVTTFEMQEIPPFNGTNNLVVIDAITGRAKREEIGVQ